MLTIAQVDPTYVAFEAETADATITAGVNESTWARVPGTSAAGDSTSASAGAALETVGQSPSACAYMGFTGGTSALHARQEILSFQTGNIIEEFSGVTGVLSAAPA